MLVGVPLDRSHSIGLLDLGVSRALIHAQNRVIVFPLALLDLKLSGTQLFTQTLGLRCDILQFAVLVYGLLPELLVHFYVTFPQVSLRVLRIQRNRRVAIRYSLLILP